MALLRQTFHEIDDRVLQASMMRDILLPPVEGRSRGKMTKQKKVCGFQVGGALAQFLHANAAVFEHTAFSINVADGGFCRWNPGKARHEIVRHGNLLPFLLCATFCRHASTRPNGTAAILKRGEPTWHTGLDGFDPDEEPIPAVFRRRRIAHQSAIPLLTPSTNDAVSHS
jgi:hypothetical protein